MFWRYGFAAIPVLAFVSFYRMGDVLALTLSHPLWNARGYSLEAIGMADGGVALAASMAGVAIGGWMAARWPMGWALAAGALASALGNWVFVWLWAVPVANGSLYLAAGIDQFGHGLAGAVFVVYLSMLVNPRYPAAQYAFLSGFAFLLPRLLAGASGTMQKSIGYDGFFVLSGALSLGAVLFLPIVLRAAPRSGDAPMRSLPYDRNHRQRGLCQDRCPISSRAVFPARRSGWSPPTAAGRCCTQAWPRAGPNPKC